MDQHNLFQLLSQPEQRELRLIGLFRQAGYVRCRLGKFDEYELFDQNRAFLEGDRMLTFTDPYGKLYALRPDVTLSVMKQAACQPLDQYRVYYHEDVFRLSPETHQYEAHNQIGIESIEKRSVSDGHDVVALAQQALASLGRESVLVLSHMGFLLENQWYTGLEQGDQDQILRYIRQKNCHDLRRYVLDLKCPPDETRKLCAATALTGEPKWLLKQIQKEQLGSELEAAAEEIAIQAGRLPQMEGQRIVADLSLVNPLSYYNGLVFQGFVKGISQNVLSGGRYDRLAAHFLRKHQTSCSAIGFAVDVDALETIEPEEAGKC